MQQSRYSSAAAALLPRNNRATPAQQPRHSSATAAPLQRNSRATPAQQPRCSRLGLNPHSGCTPNAADGFSLLPPRVASRSYRHGWLLAPTAVGGFLLLPPWVASCPYRRGWFPAPTAAGDFPLLLPWVASCSYCRELLPAPTAAGGFPPLLPRVALSASLLRQRSALQIHPATRLHQPMHSLSAKPKADRILATHPLVGE